MYDRSITRTNRGLFVLAIDESGSMAGHITYAGSKLSKAEVVTQVANNLLQELLERARRTDGIRDYYDIAVVGYSGDGVHTLLGDKDCISVVELSQLECKSVEQSRVYQHIDGSSKEIKERVNYWFEANARGKTPMYEALLTVRSIVHKWCSDPSNYYSFPPIIINITDGESTDCDYSDICDIATQIKALETTDGNALLLNIHIASDSNLESIIFPSSEQMASQSSISRSAQSLYMASSLMPEPFVWAICALRDKGEVGGKFRGVCYNSSVTELITALNIGSISVRRG